MTNQRNTRDAAVPFNNSLREKLRDMQPSQQRFAKPQRQYNRPVEQSAPEVSGIDGVDHINIWDRGETELGMVLSPMADISFKHNVFGPFRSVEGFWHYIRSVTKDDRNRRTYGLYAKKLGETFDTQMVDDFRAIILDAHYQKISQYQAIIDEVKASVLPFELYTLWHTKEQKAAGIPGRYIRPVSAAWLMKGFEEIRSALKEDRVPDFNPFRREENRGTPLNQITEEKAATLVNIPKNTLLAKIQEESKAKQVASAPKKGKILSKGVNDLTPVMATQVIATPGAVLVGDQLTDHDFTPPVVNVEPVSTIVE